MSKAKLNDTQLVLLNAAAQRANGSILPVPDSVTAGPLQLRKAIEALLARQLVLEVPVTRPDEVWREEEERRIGLTIGDAGRQAIGVGTDSESAADVGGPIKGTAGDAPVARPTGIRPGTKQAALVELLKRPGGASISEIVEATGWLPHTARAALTGLRKRGLILVPEKVDGASRYRITGTAD